MNHPMYDDRLYAKGYEVFLSMRKEYNERRKETGDQFDGLNVHMHTMDAIAKNGHVLIDVENSDWESEISEKTISSLRPRDIHFPFLAGAIKDKKSEEGVVFFRITDSFFYISFSIDDGLLAHKIRMDETFKEGILELETHRTVAYRVASVLMYIAAFKREKSRVKENTTNKLKASKKRSVPSHRIHTVFVRQPKTSREGVSHSGHSKSNMSWIVKGHWRNQWYASIEGHKPKWIDPYFKGKGKEEISKIYKVS